MDALRDPVTAHPPQDMKRGLIFLGIVVMVCCFIPVFGIEAKQVRREMDYKRANGNDTVGWRRMTDSISGGGRFT